MTTLRDGDYMDYLMKYIERNVSKGYNTDQIRLLLMNQGYSRAAVERAFRMYSQKHPKQEETAKEEPQVEVVEAPQKEEKKGFFSWLSGIFSSDKPSN